MKSGNCVKCGTYRKALHRDHIVPKSIGGSNSDDNIQWLCANCHEDKSLAEASMIQHHPIVSAKRTSASNTPEVRAAKIMGGRKAGKSLASLAALEKSRHDPSAHAKRQAGITPEVLAKRNESIKQAWAKLSPEQRTLRAMKSWNTRRRMVTE